MIDCVVFRICVMSSGNPGMLGILRDVTVGESFGFFRVAGEYPTWRDVVERFVVDILVFSLVLGSILAL